MVLVGNDNDKNAGCVGGIRVGGSILMELQYKSDEGGRW